MRLYSAQRGNDCGPIALYNVARLLRLDSTRGGYRANAARLKKLVGYSAKEGTPNTALRYGLRRELEADGFRLVNRRPHWANMIRQLWVANAPAVGLAIYQTIEANGEQEAHSVAIWLPYGRDVILAANAFKGAPVAPLYTCEGTEWWPVLPHPALRTGNPAKLLHFWQAV